MKIRPNARVLVSNTELQTAKPCIQAADSAEQKGSVDNSRGRASGTLDDSSDLLPQPISIEWVDTACDMALFCSPRRGRRRGRSGGRAARKRAIARGFLAVIRKNRSAFALRRA